MSEKQAMRLRGPLGWGIAELAVDRPVLWALLQLWLPLSRLWAAAMAAEGDPAAFLAAVPLEAKPSQRLARKLAAFEARRRDYVGAAAAWEDAFFAPSFKTPAALARLEAERSAAARWLTLQRLRFLGLRFGRPVPPVQFDIPSPDLLEAAYGAVRTEPWRAYLPPSATPTVEVSRRIANHFGEDYWLRFASPASRLGTGPASVAWARVHEPRGAINPPTFIFGNGICVEFDHYGRATADVQLLFKYGVRVIELETAWHGRRRDPGTYGGEPFMARAPLGPIDLFTAQAKELAVIVQWCRQTSKGSVAIGGASLGALAALLAACHAPYWPAAMRPDAVALLTVADQIDTLIADSALSSGVGMGEALEQAGWTPQHLLEWQGMTRVTDSPPLPPEKIVAVLGARDTILPFASGRSLVERWGVPAENTFIGGAGHFATPLGLAMDRRPLKRLARILGAR
ncbi:MAG: hypothetical protein KIT16_23365 [Rhodospirillaceae bacterium]|nr:hypothetical protein [Rhodospirillaceae bacterium]